MAPRMVHTRKALGIILLLRARSGAGVVAVFVVPGCGTGFRLVMPAASRLAGESMTVAEELIRSEGKSTKIGYGDL